MIAYLSYLLVFGAVIGVIIIPFFLCAAVSYVATSLIDGFSFWSTVLAFAEGKVRLSKVEPTASGYRILAQLGLPVDLEKSYITGLGLTWSWNKLLWRTYCWMKVSLV